MKSFLDFKNDLEGLEDVLGTVKTVEKIAASRIRLFRSVSDSASKHAEAIEKVLSALVGHIGARDNPLLAVRPHLPRMAVLVTGDKGLVGGLYRKTFGEFVATASGAAVVVLGSKGAELLADEGVSPVRTFPGIEDVPSPHDLEPIASYLIGAFLDGSYGAIDVVYPRYDTLTTQQPVTLRYLPFVAGGGAGKEDEAPGLPIYAAGRDRLFGWLLRRHMESYLTMVLLEAKLSELSARTVETENAAEKTRKAIAGARSGYLKSRRRAMTQRQLESFSAMKTRV